MSKVLNQVICVVCGRLFQAEGYRDRCFDCSAPDSRPRPRRERHVRKAVHIRPDVSSQPEIRVLPEEEELYGEFVRRCHDCGRPTYNYRCQDCLTRWREKHHVSLSVEDED